MEAAIRHISRNVPVVTLDTTVQEAAERMKQSHCGVVVVFDWWSAVGLFSEHDLMERVISERLNPIKTPVSEVMSGKPLTVAGMVDAHEALSLMRQQHERFLLLVSPEGDYEGVISTEDLLEDCNEALAVENRDLSSFVRSDQFTSKAG